MNRHLYRNSDGETSAMAAASIDTSLSERHQRALAALVAVCPATDLEMAIALRDLGFGREEACRRLVRTLREEHGRLVPALDANGQQIRHQNPTGRWAEAWIPGYAPPRGREGWIKVVWADGLTSSFNNDKFDDDDIARRCAEKAPQHVELTASIDGDLITFTAPCGCVATHAKIER